MRDCAGLDPESEESDDDGDEDEATEDSASSDPPGLEPPPPAGSGGDRGPDTAPAVGVGADRSEGRLRPANRPSVGGGRPVTGALPAALATAPDVPVLFCEARYRIEVAIDVPVPLPSPHWIESADVVR